MEKQRGVIRKMWLLMPAVLLGLVLFAPHAAGRSRAAFEAGYYNLEENGGAWDGTQYTVNGELVRDAFFCDGTDTYFLQADGTPMKDRLTYHPDGEHIIYFDENGHEVFSNFAHVKKSIAGDPVDDLCFFDVYGHMYVNVLTYNKEGTAVYYANAYGVMERHGWFRFAKGAGGIAEAMGLSERDCCYANEDGTLDLSTVAYREEGPKPTVKNYLKEALKPVGKTLYVWGGGWNDEDTAAGPEALSYGVSPRWAEFFAENTRKYDFENTRYQIHDGLDCTGFAGYTTYQMFGPSFATDGYVFKSGTMAENYQRLFGGEVISRDKIKKRMPGDIMASDGHVYIVIGQCSDGSVLFVHASPPVVSLCGTVAPGGGINSEAVALARSYMIKHHSESSQRYSSFLRDASYLKNYDQYHWDRNLLSDPDGYDTMTPAEILRDLYGD